jgi:hypothetical protein
MISWIFLYNDSIGCGSYPSFRGLPSHGARNGQAMIATLRHRLIRVPARPIRHAGALDLRLSPGYHLLEEVFARLRALPTTS